MSDAAAPTYRAQSMGFVFQAFNLIPVFTAAENVELPLLLVGVRPKDARTRAVEMLERVGLGHRTGAPTERAVRRRAAAGGDRPSAGGSTRRSCGPTSRPATWTATWPSRSLELLHEVHRDEGQTIVLVTHDAGIGASATRLVQMRDGLLVGDEPPRRQRTVEPRPPAGRRSSWERERPCIRT